VDKARRTAARIAAKAFTVGQKVHVDTDNEERGRVASDGVVLAAKGQGLYPVQIDSVRANLIVPSADIVHREE
jgi:hypothetical protein